MTEGTGLLVVIAIMAVLAALPAAALAELRERSRVASCTKNPGQPGPAVKMNAGYHDEGYPHLFTSRPDSTAVAALDLPVPRYFKGGGVFACHLEGCVGAYGNHLKQGFNHDRGRPPRRNLVSSHMRQSCPGGEKE